MFGLLQRFSIMHPSLVFSLFAIFLLNGYRAYIPGCIMDSEIHNKQIRNFRWEHIFLAGEHIL